MGRAARVRRAPRADADTGGGCLAVRRQPPAASAQSTQSPWSPVLPSPRTRSKKRAAKQPAARKANRHRHPPANHNHQRPTASRQSRTTAIPNPHTQVAQRRAHNAKPSSPSAAVPSAWREDGLAFSGFELLQRCRELCPARRGFGFAACRVSCACASTATELLPLRCDWDWGYRATKGRTRMWTKTEHRVHCTHVRPRGGRGARQLWGGGHDCGAVAICDLINGVGPVPEGWRCV
jgi:hypothetical protein